jgi:ElaB/YqjD/DUF883 family membrane-anchored ribosome-binding protein
MATQEAGTARTQGPGDEGLASQVQQQVQEKAHDLKGQASRNLRPQRDDRSTEIGEQVHSLGDALRRAGEQLAEEGKAMPAGAARRAADGVERLGRYLRDGNGDVFLNDLEKYGRKRPWISGGVGMAVGIAASRFLKASSDRRYNTVQSARSDLDAPLTRSGAALETGPLGASATLPPVQGGRPA